MGSVEESELANMFKRAENSTANEYSIPAKRPKYDTNRGTLVGVGRTNRASTHKRSGKSDDIWGDDFAEEDIEEMDFVASQACLQVSFIFTLHVERHSARVYYLKAYLSSLTCSRSLCFLFRMTVS